MKRVERVLMTALAVVAAASCSSHTAPTIHTNQVSVQDNFFTPQQVTVAVGDSVTFTWAGAVQHNVTFNDGPASVSQQTGTYKRVFTATGTYPYHCTIHGLSMSGTIVVN